MQRNNPTFWVSTSLLIDNKKSSRRDRNPRHHWCGDHVGAELLFKKLLQRSCVMGRHANRSAQRVARSPSEDHIQWQVIVRLYIMIIIIYLFIYENKTHTYMLSLSPSLSFSLSLCLIYIIKYNNVSTIICINYNLNL